jgi:hypothetical protein
MTTRCRARSPLVRVARGYFPAANHAPPVLLSAIAAEREFLRFGPEMYLSCPVPAEVIGTAGDIGLAKMASFQVCAGNQAAAEAVCS